MVLIILRMITLLCFMPSQCFPEWLCLPLEFFKLLPFTFYFQVPLVVKNLPDNAGDARGAGSITGLGRSPGEGHATHPSIHALEILWTEEPGRLQSTGLQGVRHDWSDFTCAFYFSFCSVQFSCSVMSNSLRPHGLQHSRLPCSSPTPRVYSNSCPLSQWCHPAISSSVVPFSSCLQSFPTSRSFPVNQFFASGGQSIGDSASTSVLSMYIQDWFLLGWTGWISLQSKGPSRVFSNTTVQKHQFFSAQISL